MSVKVTVKVRGVKELQAASARFDRALQSQVHSCLVRWVELVKEEAQAIVPVRTGYLRSTIYAMVREWVVRVGAEAAYAAFVEYGTRRMQARAYLDPAVRMYLPRLESMLVEAIDRAKEEAGFE